MKTKFIHVVISFFLANIVAASVESSEIQLKTLLTGSHSSEILSLDSSPQGQVLSLSRDDLKIWDLSGQELIKTFQEPRRYYKAQFSSDGSKIYALSHHKFSAYNSSDFSEAFSITDDTPEDAFLASRDGSRMYVPDGYRTMGVYDLVKKEKRGQFKIELFDTFELTPDEKYILAFDRHRKKAHFYKAETGALVNSITFEKSAQKVYLLDNERVAYISDEIVKKLDKRSYKSSYEVYNFKTSVKESSIVFDGRVVSAKAVENLNISLLALEGGSTVQVHSLEGASKNKRFTALPNVSNHGLHLSKNGQLLAVGSYNGKFAVYDASGYFTVNDESANDVVEIPEPALEIVEENIVEEVIAPQPVVVEEPAPIQVPNQTLKIVPSITEGIVPLEVTFSIITGFPELVESHYINASGKESMNAGPPPMSFNKVFHRPGTYKVFVAVRDKDGKIVDQEVVIKPREQSFSDFKAAN